MGNLLLLLGWLIYFLNMSEHSPMLNGIAFGLFIASIILNIKKLLKL